MGTVWLQFLPRTCRAQTSNEMPKMHKMTPKILKAGFTGANLMNLNMVNLGS